MDPSKLVTSWCVGNILGLYSLMVILLGVIASSSAFPTGSVITQASLPGDQSLADSSPRQLIVTFYIRDLQETLNLLCEKFVEKRFGESEPPPFKPALKKLPNISDVLPNGIFISEDLPRRMWIHLRLLHLFNRSMDNIIFDEGLNNASYDFSSKFYALQNKIERVLAGVFETVHDRSWEQDDESVTITQDLEGIFSKVRMDILRNRRDYTVLSFFNEYLSTLNSDIHLLE